jgi:DNA-binding CsgD family transcriptional regulator
MREWSIACRANDLRITPMHVPIVPEKAPRHLEPHDVHLTRSVLLQLCGPVGTDRPHTQLPKMAKRMGVQPDIIRKQIRLGHFRLERYKYFQAKPDRWGGIPFVYADKDFDPNYLNRHQGPDPVWGTWWQSLPLTLPEDFEQIIRRVPQWHADPTASHMDHVFRKKDAHATRRIGLHDEESYHHRFWGWRWLCPACQSTCRLIFCPTAVPLPHFIEDYLEKHCPHEPKETTWSFACAKCHKLRGGLSWANKDAWNHVITQLSGGLLYGHEVEIPKWLKRQIKFPAKRKPQNRPSPRREEVEQRLREGMSTKQIAQDLGMSQKTVYYHIFVARKFHHATTRKHLIQLLRAKHQQKTSKSA